MRRPYYGWIVVFACFLGTFVVFGLSYSFGVFFERMIDEFGYSRGATSLAFGVQTLSLYVGASVIGAFVDRYGTRRMLVVGTVLLCAGLLLTSQSTSLVTLVFAYGIVMGLGMSVVYVVSYATVPRWFDRRQGFAAGVASAGLGVGMLVVAPGASWLVDIVGWRDAFLVLTAGTAVLLALMTLLIRDDPATAGRNPPTDEFERQPDSEDARSWREQYEAVRTIALKPSFLLLFGGWVLIYTTLYVVFAHLVVHGVDLGHSRAVGATAISIIGLFSAIGRVLIGYVGDVAGRVRVFVVCSVVMGGATVLLPLAHSVLAIFAFAAVYGFAYGGNGALFAPLTVDLFGRANINAVFGLVSMSFALSGLASPSLAGAGHDVLGTYDPVFVAAGVAALVGAVAVAGASRMA